MAVCDLIDGATPVIDLYSINVQSIGNTSCGRLSMAAVIRSVTAVQITYSRLMNCHCAEPYHNESTPMNHHTSKNSRVKKTRSWECMLLSCTKKDVRCILLSEPNLPICMRLTPGIADPCMRWLLPPVSISPTFTQNLIKRVCVFDACEAPLLRIQQSPEGYSYRGLTLPRHPTRDRGGWTSSRQ